MARHIAFLSSTLGADDQNSQDICIGAKHIYDTVKNNLLIYRAQSSIKHPTEKPQVSGAQK